MVLKTFRTHSQVNLLKPGERRFATQFIMLDRLRNSKESVIKCYIDPVLAESVSKKAPSYKELFQTAKDLIFDPQFWLDVNYLYAILEPIIKLLRLSDNSSKIPVGFVGVIYHQFYSFTINVANFTYRNRIHRSDMIKLVNDRWVQLHSPLHSAGFCVHPAYQGYDQHTNQDVWKDFLDVIDRWCDFETKKSILSQYSKYREKRGLFCSDLALVVFNIKDDDPIAWWSNLGCEVPELQAFATKVLSQSVSASPCETNWSLYDWIVNKKRNRLTPDKQRDLVYINVSLRFVKNFSSI